MPPASQFPALSPRQHLALVRLIEFIETNKVPPTVRELAASISAKSSNVDVYLLPLIEKGYVEKLPVASRRYLPTKLAQAWWLTHRPVPEPTLPLGL